MLRMMLLIWFASLADLPMSPLLLQRGDYGEVCNKNINKQPRSPCNNCSSRTASHSNKCPNVHFITKCQCTGCLRPFSSPHNMKAAPRAPVADVYLIPPSLGPSGVGSEPPELPTSVASPASMSNILHIPKLATDPNHSGQQQSRNAECM